MTEPAERLHGGTNAGAGPHGPANGAGRAVQRSTFATSVQIAENRTLYNLFLLNIVLQMFDGMATYSGLSLGVREANPLLRTAFTVWGAGATLLLLKSLACGLLLLLYRITHEDLATQALYTLVGIYFACSLVPWLAVFLFVSLSVP